MKPLNRGLKVAGSLIKVSGLSQKAYFAEGKGHLLLTQGATLPTLGDTGYRKGCKFILTGAAAGLNPVYINVGNETSADFQIVGNIGVGITTSAVAGAIPLTGWLHEITTAGTGIAMTLANGTAGQKLTIVYVAEGAGGDTAILTPATLAGGTTITFNALGDGADLTYSVTGGWYMTGGTAAIA